MENGRLLKELREIETDERCGVKVELVDGKLNHMTGTIHGALPRQRTLGVAHKPLACLASSLRAPARRAVAAVMRPLATFGRVAALRSRLWALRALPAEALVY